MCVDGLLICVCDDDDDDRDQELLSKDIPKPEQNGVKCAVIAGEALGAASKVLTKTPICYLDFTLEPGAEHIQTVPKGWNAFAYVVQVKKKRGGERKAETTSVFESAAFFPTLFLSCYRLHILLSTQSLTIAVIVLSVCLSLLSPGPTHAWTRTREV